MEKKKTKLTLSGNIKKSISNIEKAKSQGKNSVFIEKKITSSLAGKQQIIQQDQLIKILIQD